jgi:hypothetical protein
MLDVSKTGQCQARRPPPGPPAVISALAKRRPFVLLCFKKFNYFTLPNSPIDGERPAMRTSGIGCASVLASLAVVSSLSLVTAPSSSGAAAASCIGSDADVADLEAREAGCLRELGKRASRTGNVLSLKLDNGTTKTFRSDPEACKNDRADKCVNYRLVGFHPLAGRYLVYVTGYENFECRLVSARTGRATTFLNIPHFAPDDSTFFVTGYDGNYDNWIGIGSVASDPPALVWEMGPTMASWEFLRWITNDQVALRDTAQDESCPKGNCEAILKRTGDVWVIEHLLRPDPK